MNMIIKTAISDAGTTWLNYLTYSMNMWNEQKHFYHPDFTGITCILLLF